MINLKNFLDHKTHIDFLSLKKNFVLNQLKQLTEHHYNRYKEDKKILVSKNYSFKKIKFISDFK